MANIAITIEKLNASNYTSWCNDMKFVLMERNAWEIVTGAESEPTLNENRDNQKEVNDFRTRRRIALSLIYLYVEPDFRKIIEQCNDPTDSWKKLKNHYFPDNRSLHMSLFTELMNARIEGNEPIDLFAARLRRLYDRIKAVDNSLNEIYLCFQLLRYLPPEFDSIVQNELRLSESDFKYDHVLQDLVAEETRIKLREKDQQNQYSSYTASQTTYVPSQVNRRNFKCFRCNRAGHFQRNCRVRFHTPSQRKTTYNRPRSTNRDSSSNNSVKFRTQGQNSQRPYQPSEKSGPNEYANYFASIEANLNQTNMGESEWIFDTAASHHFCKNKSLFKNFTPLTDEKMAVAVEGANFPIEGKGIVELKFGPRKIFLHEVMYSSKLRRNLISGPRFDKGESVFYGKGGRVSMSDKNGKFIFNAKLKNGVYVVKPTPIKPIIPKIKTRKVTFHTSGDKNNKIELWHRRLAHINTYTIKQTSDSNSVYGLPKFNKIEISCDECKLNKFKRTSFKKQKHIRSRQPLELLYSDTWGPCQTAGRGGEKYFLSIIDDFSRKTNLYPMRQKSEAFQIISRHIVNAERFLGRKVKAIRTDNGKEFVNTALETFCKKLGINHELTNIYTPEENGPAERFNQTVANGARTTLAESGLDQSFWPEAMLHFTYTWNRVCHKGWDKTPFELYNGRKPSVKHLRPFGTSTFIGIPKQLRNKLDAKAKRGILIGYASRTKGYRVWIPEENKIVETINVMFKEGTFYHGNNKSGAVLGTTIDWRPNYDECNANSDDEETIVKLPSDLPPVRPQSEIESSDEDEKTPQPERNTIWIRKVVPRPDGTRVDVYYYKKGDSTRLRSIMDVQKYCLKYNIMYEPQIFNFRGTDSTQGEISSHQGNITEA